MIDSIATRNTSSKLTVKLYELKTLSSGKRLTWQQDAKGGRWKKKFEGKPVRCCPTRWPRCFGTTGGGHWIRAHLARWHTYGSRSVEPRLLPSGWVVDRGVGAGDLGLASRFAELRLDTLVPRDADPELFNEHGHLMDRELKAWRERPKVESARAIRAIYGLMP